MTELSTGEARARAQLGQWREELIDLSKRNRALYYKPTKNSSLEVLAPSAVSVLEGFERGDTATFLIPPGDDEEWTPDPDVVELGPGEMLSDKPNATRTNRALDTIARAAREDFQDAGLQTLYMAFGMLDWDDGDDTVASPLLYVPVQMSRPSPRDSYRITLDDADPVVNAALQAKLLRDFDIELPALDALTENLEGGLPALFQALTQRVRALVGPRGWTVTGRTVMTRATFHKDAMFRDLLDNADAILAHELVQALAGEAVAQNQDPPSPADMDRVAPPEDALLTRDADSTQRACIQAALDGISFVMDGPPGTGKSQTIANMIGELTRKGKTILFVSEKAAALEVVANRLEDRGLGELFLELHSHKTSRKAVVDELANALKQYPKPGQTLSPQERSSAQRHRTQLSNRAEQMNRIRQPLGMSLAQAIGRVALLEDALRVPAPNLDVADLDADRLQELNEAFAALARVWHLRIEPDFPWTGYDAAGLTQGDISNLELELRGLRDTVADLEVRAESLALELLVPAPDSLAGISRLCDLTEHLRDRPDTPLAWWTGDLNPVRESLGTLGAQIIEITKQASQLAATVGRWRVVHPERIERLYQVVRELAAHRDVVPPKVARSTEDLSLEITVLKGASTAFKALESATAAAAAALGIPERDRTTAASIAVLEVASASDAPVRPEEGWVSPMAIQQVRRALDSLEPLLTDYRARKALLERVFTDAVFDLDLVAIEERYRTRHKGLRKLGSAYRADRNAVRSVARSGQAGPLEVSRLAEALDLKRLADTVGANEQRTLLGAHFDAVQTDVDAARSALAILERAHDALGPDFGPSLAGQLAGDAPKDPSLATRAKEALDNFLAWRRTAPEAIASLADNHTVTAVSGRLGRIEPLLGELHAVLTTLEPSKPLDLTEVAQIPVQVRQHAAAVRELQAAEPEYRKHLAALYEGLDTPVHEVEERLSWTATLQDLVPQPLTSRAASALHDAETVPGTADMRNDAAALAERLRKLAAAFMDEHRTRVQEEFAGRTADIQELLGEMVERIDDLTGYQQLLRNEGTLRNRGYTHGLQHLTSTAADPDDVVDALTRATFASWVDHQMQGDPLLADQRADDLDALVADYRTDDRTLLERAPHAILATALEGRPTQSSASTQTIRTEAQKRRRHMPVRTLLERCQEIILKLRPCLMMSPLSVSQFLPAQPGMFDVVIFDEASQVTPADAINCIYRGQQLIVAGDDRQLPPTSFFSTVGTDGDDGYQADQLDEFESVLGLVKSQGGLPQLGLRWHYRSQHEDLITFSNRRFYEGELVTFPSAMSTAPDLGVSLKVVDGIYMRGASRDNPIEAEHVADRMLEIAATHPELSVGIVAFSSAQQHTIENALEMKRRERPELDDWFTEDRLNGYFVKNLESVQGDERDVILFSVGYGPDEAGKLTLNFGPLNRETGWRRLNVAITRAKRRVEIFSSFGPGQLDTRGTNARGVHELKRYLEFAQQGISALAQETGDGEGDVESPFEESVLRVIRGWGYDVTPQVGVSQYRIDLGVRHPDEPGRYVLGVECDGAAYHSSAVARDRDRLRQEVLERLGWNLHRIWGTSWYRDRTQQEARLKAAIEAAVVGRIEPTGPTGLAPVKHDEVYEIDLDAPPDWVEWYVTAPRRGPFPGRPTDPEAAARVRDMVAEVVRVEAPVAIPVIGRRVADAWGCSLTKKVRQVVANAVEAAIRTSPGLSRDGDFVIRTDSAPVRVRCCTEDRSFRRNVDEIHRSEIDAAVAAVIRDGITMLRDDVKEAFKTVFEFSRAGANIQTALDASLDRLVDAGVLLNDEMDTYRFIAPPPL
ncbi:DNA helicase related protein [Euzebya pacifica]|uniref:DNA helicase related protein n=1 Tax=Euzebya pacifica TaxID=1608957 RepID=A0A346XRY1_9ACTN|nr:DUF3320 domain-containing protein [Euzebya pacifica]AXV04978.1 DNA helicase related protein [Euzebya pacifica]